MPPPSWIRNKGVRDVRELAGKGREGGWIMVGFVLNIFLKLQRPYLMLSRSLFLDREDGDILMYGINIKEGVT